MKVIRYLMTRLMLGIIHIYRFIFSPFVGHHCRFHPTCSAYAIEAIEKHGPFRGGFLTIKRLCRCHPWGKPGIDPVPEAKGSGFKAQDSAIAHDQPLNPES